MDWAVCFVFQENNTSTWWLSVSDLFYQGHDNEDAVEYVSEDDLYSLPSSDGEVDPKKKSKNNKQYNTEASMEGFKFNLGMEFATVNHFRTTLKEYFSSINREYKWVFNDKKRRRAKCKKDDCGWVMYARVQLKDNTSFRVNTMVDKHDFGLVYNNKHATSAWLSKHFLEHFRINPNLKYSGFMELTSKTKFSHTTSSVFYGVKKKAMQMLEWSVKEQYAILEDYCKKLIHTNPVTTTLLKTTMIDGNRVFERVYVCLKACKDGFKK
ncbi:uncharacterized protein LOC133829091 [Humulus lupulus]|uniref:uncharacterized protein LOC133829091 n=1 Tax=Humulus lupulus TaxID=3486 RepID=UPI002B4147C8|nr:uncharacterized protein LOC133829091 [Humulus lupulus]